MYVFFNSVFFNLFFIFYITSRLHHTHYTPLWRGRQPRKPTKAPAANEGRRRPTKREKGPNDARRVVWAGIGKFFFNVFFFYCTTYLRKPTKAHSSQRRPTQAHKDGKRPIGLFFLIMYFFKIYNLSTATNEAQRRPTKTERKPMKAHSSQRRPTQARAQY